MDTTDVAVVGGGPVGMTVAALLRRTGVAVRVLERRPERAGQSRATTIHPRTLEVLDVLPADPGRPDGPSLAEAMVAAGTPVPAAHFATLDHLLSYDRLDTAYPFVLMLPQPETERLLAEHLTAAGVVIETGREVLDLRQDTGHVELTTDDGRTVRARFAVGADGAHSAVRRAAGIGFPGSPATQAGFLADVRLDRPPAEPHHWDVDRGAYSVLPLPGGVHRIFGQEPADTGLTPEQAGERMSRAPDADELRAILRRVTGGDDLGVREVLWTSRSGNATRHAERYDDGRRVLLAGDAAHVHLPAGGQGLNVGVQDAANLAWKLVARLAGRAPDRLVDGAQSFDAERRPVAERLAADTLAQSAIMSTFTPAGRALRDMMDGLIARDGDTADTLRGWLSGLDVAYDPPGVGVEAAPAGRRVPSLPLVGGGTLHRALRPDRFVLAALDPTGVPAPDDERVLSVRAARGWDGARAVLVRPDGHAAAVWRPADAARPDDVSRVVASWTGSARAMGTAA